MILALQRPLLPTVPGQASDGWTWADYRDLDEHHEGFRPELLQGELWMSPSPSTIHQRLIMRLIRRLGEAIPEAIGEVFVAPYDMHLDPHSAPQPDLLVVLAANRQRITEACLEGPADLVVEVVSAFNAARDTKRKRLLYAHHGVPEYWIVDPDAKRLMCLRLDGQVYPDAPWLAGDDVVRSGIVPGEARSVAWWIG